jgi:alpha-N-arabinofuranosidase
VSGSPTYPLDVIAGLSPDRPLLRIGVVNATFEPQRIDLKLAHGVVTGPGTVRWLTALRLKRKTASMRRPRCRSPNRTVSDAGSFELPPLSISVFELPFDEAEQR